jgi:hypothetical protein
LPTFEPLCDALARVIEEAGGLIAVRLITVCAAPAMLNSGVGIFRISPLSPSFSKPRAFYRGTALRGV